MRVSTSDPRRRKREERTACSENPAVSRRQPDSYDMLGRRHGASERCRESGEATYTVLSNSVVKAHWQPGYFRRS
jgi:hypothetical protein